MGLLLSKEQKSQIKEALEETEVPCRYYLATFMDAKRWAKVFSDRTCWDEPFMVAVIEDIKLWMSMFPKGSNIPDPSAYAAHLYEFMCEENSLTRLGVKMMLDKTLKSKKYVPSIYEISTELKPVRDRFLEFKKSREEFMRCYHNAERELIKRLDEEGVTSSLSDVLNFKCLLGAWDSLFPYDAFPGCDVWLHPFKQDKATDLVINALSKPRDKNPLLMVFMVIIEVAQKEKILQYHMADIYEEMARLYPEVPVIGGELEAFYLPNQWRNLDLSKLKPNPEHDTGLFDYEELIPALIDPERRQTKISEYIRKITRDYFAVEAMFE